MPFGTNSLERMLNDDLAVLRVEVVVGPTIVGFDLIKSISYGWALASNEESVSSFIKPRLLRKHEGILEAIKHSRYFLF